MAECYLQLNGPSMYMRALIIIAVWLFDRNHLQEFIFARKRCLKKKEQKRELLFCDFFPFNDRCHSAPSDILIDLLVLIFPVTLIVPRRGGAEVSALGKYSAACCEYCVFCIH